MPIVSFIEAMADLLLPRTCSVCGLPGRDLCDGCCADLVPLSPPMCDRCGYPLEVATPRCAHCRGRVSHARSAVSYAGPALALTAAAKRRPRAAREMALLMAELLAPPEAGVPLVPIPLAPRAEYRRGFNQSEVIARDLARAWRRPLLELLTRRDDGVSQRGASRSARAEQVRGAFVAPARDAVPRAVCLIDDVHTTGATLAAAAEALFQCGARRVSARCFARTPKDRMS